MGDKATSDAKLNTSFGVLTFMKTTKKVTEEKVESLPVEVQVEDTMSSEITKEVKINHYTGDFGRVDINLLRDKVNEVIDFLNK